MIEGPKKHYPKSDYETGETHGGEGSSKSTESRCYPEKGMQVSLEHLEKVLQYLAKIEKQSLHEIRWMKDGKQVPATKAMVSEWLTIGLNNREYAKCHFLK